MCRGLEDRGEGGKERQAEAGIHQSLALVFYPGIPGVQSGQVVACTKCLQRPAKFELKAPEFY